MNCPCDVRIWPLPLAIPSGLRSLPRQQFDFVGLRTAMFDSLRHQPALATWTTRAREDWGVMLLELWAYTGEILSLYDKVIADESYVRTAVTRPSLMRLVELLGYQPRPAIAGTIELAAIAEGVRPVVLPSGAAFRSGAFDGEPPQVFEVVQPVTIHPALSRWELAVPLANTVPGIFEHLMFDPRTIRFATGEVVLVEIDSGGYEVYARRIEKVERVVDGAGRRAVRVVFEEAIAHSWTPIPIAKLSVLRARRIASLKSPSAINGEQASFVGGSTMTFALDGVYPEARKSTLALAQRGGDLRWFRIDVRAEQALRTQADSATPATTIDTPDGTVTIESVPVGPLTAMHTVLSASTLLTKKEGLATPARASWSSVAPDELVVHVGFEPAGRVLGEPRTTIETTDPLVALGTRMPITSVAETSRIILRDAEQVGAAVDASIDLATGKITTPSDATWPPLATPVEAFGNIVTAVRGETVLDESIGSGNAALAHQTFTLAKHPLTYVVAPHAANGYASTLRVWVDGFEWFEVSTLFGQPPTAQVFTVRVDDDEVAHVTFGDGVHGARLSTGASNVIARYRFGAGAKVPPAGSVTQIARPAPGLRTIVGPMAATGGADRETATALRELAPRSAMLLGRAISIEDMEVAALGVPGVVVAHATWAWDGKLQRPVVKVWIVGDAAAPAAVTARLRALSDPSTPIRAEAATALPTTVALDLELEPRRIAEDVLAAVRVALVGEGGALAPRTLGIGQPVVRSRIVTALLDMPGVTGVRGITWGVQPMLAWAVDPGVGTYFDLGAGPTVTGS